MFEKTCDICTKKFETDQTYPVNCYDCELKRIIGDGCPEEGDFNTASILAGVVHSPEVQRAIDAEREVQIRLEEGDDDDDGYYDYYDSDGPDSLTHGSWYDPDDPDQMESWGKVVE